MNYRHIYHAGNICDVVKHAVLVLLLQQLGSKDKPFCVLDTHAGIGLYDLHDPRALKTNEAQSGILKLITASAAPELESYLSLLQKLNPAWDASQSETLGAFHLYAGSPSFIRQSMRPQDRLIACELHEEDVQELRRLFHADKQVHIHHRNGYEAMRAFLPPVEKRGLVLIDPPYEEPDEFEKLVKALVEAHQRWPQGMFAVWYPIKERPAIWRFHEALIATGMPKQLCVEFMYQDEVRHDRLNGSGLILINPPWQTDEKLKQLFTVLHQALETPDHGDVIKWLTPA